MSTVTLTVQVQNRTDLALLVDNGRNVAWVPRQHIQVVEVDHVNQMAEITIPTWLAIEKGLTQGKDTATPDLFGGAA